MVFGASKVTVRRRPETRSSARDTAGMAGLVELMVLEPADLMEETSEGGVVSAMGIGSAGGVSDMGGGWMTTDGTSATSTGGTVAMSAGTAIWSMADWQVLAFSSV